MNKAIAISLATMAFAAIAEINLNPPAQPQAETDNEPIPYDYEEGERSDTIITPQAVEALSGILGEDMAKKLVHAAKLQMQKYDRDMKSDSGRREWHGNFLHEEINLKELCKVMTYSNKVNGAVWRYKLPFKPKPVKPTGRRTTFSTNGIPVELARARARRAKEIETGTVVTNMIFNASGVVK